MRQERITLTLTPTEIRVARQWLSDCEFVETELLIGEDRAEFFAEMSDETITRAVAQHYGGGLAQFRVDSDWTI